MLLDRHDASACPIDPTTCPAWEALEWLLQYHPKIIGTDASGVELSDGYDEDGRMISAYPSLRPVNEDANVVTAFVASKKPQNAVTARAFLWDGFETISDTMTLFE
jgi:hypothetical protein